MKIEPGGDYLHHDIPFVSSRSDCEDLCTELGTEISDECWMVNYYIHDQLCRLITGPAMPHWNETCDWLVGDSSWEAWKRNCFG